MIEFNRIGYQIDELQDSVINAGGNAPLTRVKWECGSLPEGLMLSESGELSGCPSAAGEYECTVKASTNWGTDIKTLRIVIEE